MKKQQKLEEGLNRLFSSSRKSSSTPADESLAEKKSEKSLGNEETPEKSNAPIQAKEFSVLLPMPEKPSLPLMVEGLDEESLNLEHLQSLLGESGNRNHADIAIPDDNNQTSGISLTQFQPPERKEDSSSSTTLPDPTLYFIKADISPKSIASAARAFQLLLCLQELGTTTSLEPSQEVIETAKPVHHLEATLSSHKTADEVEKMLRLVDEIDQLSITLKSNRSQVEISPSQTKPVGGKLIIDGKKAEPTTAVEQQKVFTDEQVVVFTLQSQSYGVAINCVDAIIKMQPITVVPGAPYYIDGVTNLRGNVLPVINLHKRLDLDDTEVTPNHRIIVVSLAGISAGMTVDSVSSVTQLEGQAISEPSKVVSPDSDISYIRAVAKHNDELILLLELSKILEEKRN